MNSFVSHINHDFNGQAILKLKIVFLIFCFLIANLCSLVINALWLNPSSPLFCSKNISCCLFKFWAKPDKKVIFESSVSKFSNFFYFLIKRFLLIGPTKESFCLFYFFQIKNMIRSFDWFLYQKSSSSRENISLFYLFLFLQNKNILRILLQCSNCDNPPLPPPLYTSCWLVYLLKKYVGG